MRKKLNFTYESIGNYVRLLCTLQYESSHTGKECSLWHKRFDAEDGDDLFESFLEELYPQGGTIDIESVGCLTARAEQFLTQDDTAIQQRVEYEKLEYPNWVYFKIDRKVIPCEYAKHQETVCHVCMDYFKDCDDIDLDYLRRFILNNFEIKSSNSTLSAIAEDAAYIARSVILKNLEV